MPPEYLIAALIVVLASRTRWTALGQVNKQNTHKFKINETQKKNILKIMQKKSMYEKWIWNWKNIKLHAVQVRRG